MGLFDFFKKEESPKVQEMESKLLLSMPVFKNGDRYSIVDVVSHLRSEWALHVEGDNINDDTAVFTINGNTVAVAYMPVAIPREEIVNAADYNYNWETASEDLIDMTGHVIVTVMSSDMSVYDRYQILSKMLCSILATSKAVGVYQGSQTLLISREDYLDHKYILERNDAPVALWVYVGIQMRDMGNTLYTYGLKEFGFMEVEVINSQIEIEELFYQ